MARCRMCGEDRGWAIICQGCGFILCEGCMKKVRKTSFWGGASTTCPNCGLKNRWREIS